MPEGTGSPLLWLAFATVVGVVLALDMRVAGRGRADPTFREAARATLVRVGFALGFGAWLWTSRGAERGLEFLTGYLIELALSVDNVFVFLLVFASFRVRPAQQARVLFWGIAGALVLRGLFIAAGSALFERFEWTPYVFGGFLLAAAAKLLRGPQTDVHPERGLAVRAFRRVVPLLRRSHDDRFWVRGRGRWYATPLLLALVAIEASDIAFAVESVPTVLAITRDPFIVYTSNVFAVIGLRSMFFLVAGGVARFAFLHQALAAILGFIGLKMLLAGFIHVPIVVSLGVVGGILVVAIVASWLAGPRPGRFDERQAA
jgi:TerC family integral membrane protein